MEQLTEHHLHDHVLQWDLCLQWVAQQLGSTERQHEIVNNGNLVRLRSDLVHKLVRN